MRLTALAAILASTTMLGGCAGTIAGVSLGSISSFAGFASTIFTGADLGEHAASLITGKDCRFSESMVRSDRKVCEDAGSPATRDDFRGIFVERVEADGTVVYAAVTPDATVQVTQKGQAFVRLVAINSSSSFFT